METFPVPFLFEISGRMRHAHVAETPDEDTQVSGKVKVNTVEGRAPVIPSEESFVMPLRKVATAVPSAITFGRGSANDVIIPDGFVSKVHAFLRHSARTVGSCPTPARATASGSAASGWIRRARPRRSRAATC